MEGYGYGVFQHYSSYTVKVSFIGGGLKGVWSLSDLSIVFYFLLVISNSNPIPLSQEITVNIIVILGGQNFWKASRTTDTMNTGIASPTQYRYVWHMIIQSDIN
jgi:hypothetical protein